MKTKKIALFGLLIAVAFLFSYLESLYPIFIMIPGMKVGFANLVLVPVLYWYGVKDAFFLSFLRILAVSMTFGNMSMFIYSMAGSGCSFLVMYLCYRYSKLSVVGVSAVGGVMHNIGQMVVAMCILNNMYIYYYLPALFFAGIIAGVVVGIVSGELIKRLKPLIGSFL